MHSSPVSVIMRYQGQKGQKVVRACTIRLLNLGPAKHEEVAIYEVNLRIPNVCRIGGSCEAAEQFVDIGVNNQK